MDARFEGALTHKGLEVWHSGYSVVGNNAEFGSDTSKRWRRFASCTITGSNTDREVTFLVTPGYGATTQHMGATFGVLTAHIRAGSGINSVQCAELYWHYAGWGVDPSNFVLCHKLTAGSSLYCELWCANVNPWSCYAFQVLSEGDRTYRHLPGTYWTTYNDTSGGAGSTGAPGSGSGYTQVASKVMTGGEQTATSGVWSYRRRADGTFDAWCRWSGTPQITSPLDGSYYAQVSISLPFTAASIACATATADSGRAVWAAVSYYDQSTVRLFLCAGAQVSGATVAADVRVTGRWR